MPDFIGVIFFIILWLFIISRISRVFRNAANTNNKQEGGNPRPEVRQNKSLRELVAEMRREAELAKTADREPAKDPFENSPHHLKQQVVVHEKKILSKEESSDSNRFENFVKREKEKNYSSVPVRPTEKIYLLSLEDEYEPFTIDIRHALIGSFIFDAPYL